MKNLAGLTLTEAQFTQLRALCRADRELPDSWIDWNAMIATANSLAELEGRSAGNIALDVDHFEGWCRLVGIVPCVDALRAYSIVMKTISDGMGAGQAA